MLLRNFGQITRRNQLRLWTRVPKLPAAVNFSTAPKVESSPSATPVAKKSNNFTKVKDELVQTFQNYYNINKSPTNERRIGNTSHSIELYNRQLALEEEQFDSAVKEYVEAQAELIAMGRGTGMKNIQKTMVEWYDPFCVSIEATIAKMAKDAKLKAKDVELYRHLTILSPEKIAVISLDTTVNNILASGNSGVKLLKLAMDIGNILESESGIVAAKRALGKVDKSDRSFFDKETVLTTLKSSAASHESKMLTKKLRRISNEPEWSNESKVTLGSILLDLLLKSARKEGTGEPVFQHSYSFTNKSKKIHGQVKIDPEEFESLALKDIRRITPRLLPMLVPPREWNNKQYRGAYLTLKVPLMKTYSSAQSDAVKEADMKDVLEGLDYLGKTAWRINDTVLDTIEEIWNSNLMLGEVPSNSNLPPPDKDKPEFMRTPREIQRSRAKWNKDYKPQPGAPECVPDDLLDVPVFDQKLYDDMVRRVGKKNNELHSLRCDLLIKLGIAKQFRGEVMYFPHNLDFRGRAYPVPPNLSHLGSDLCRGLMVFNQTRPLGEEGFLWLKIHLCNLYGNNKIPLGERVKWTEAHMADIMDSASQPLKGARWWSTFESPFQALACCVEIKRAIDSGNPAAFLSNLPIHQDGSCNGLQHYAGLGRDEKGAQAVNLVPSGKPQDVYSEVLVLVKEQVALDAQIDESVVTDPILLARKTNAQLVMGKVDRKVIKQTVMTSVYGVTRTGARAQVQARLEDKAVEETPGLIITKEIESQLFGAAHYLANLTLTSLERMFTSAKGIMDWLSDCSIIVSEQGQTMSWVTPLGLPVSQPYRRPGSHVVKTVLQSITLARTDDSLPVSAKKQKSAFPPNFVHSLDATHMLMTCLKMKHEGRTFASVHDSYWTHACDVTLMNELLRECFVHLYEYPVLEDFKDSLDMRFPGNEFPDIPVRGNLDIRVVKDSQYFFH